GRMFKLAIKANMLTTMPPLPTIKVRNVRKGFFEPDEITRVLATLPEDLRPPIEFAYITGWRIGEICDLKWANVDVAGCVVRLDPGTTKKDEGRTFPFAKHPRLGALIVAQMERTLAVQRQRGKIIPWVFWREGEQIGEFKRTWANACKTAKVPGKLVHDLRRTAVRNLVRAGVPERVAMQLTGHKTRAVFDRYDIVSEADLSAAVEKLSRQN
ncbi:MAG: site-specific integrase, partial [Candidatus Rokuibacteriota bacterium]